VDTISNARVTLREITKATLWPILKLDVAEDQKQFVAPNSVSIAEAHFSDSAWFRAIYADDEPVGFVMLNLDEDKPEYWVWRLMIGEGHQCKGYGSTAMRRVIERVQGLPGARELFVSYSPGDGNASPFYQKLGFKETGEWLDGEKVMKLLF